MVHGQRTVFPISLGLASSFNLEAVRTVGRVSAYEAADDGLNMTSGADGGRFPRSALGGASPKGSVKILI